MSGQKRTFGHTMQYLICDLITDNCGNTFKSGCIYETATDAAVSLTSLTWFIFYNPPCHSVGKKLFGEGYSGLEYDYRGLIKLYNSVGNYEKVFEYHNVLSNWNRLRDRQFAVADALEDVNTTPQQTQEVVKAFLLAQSLGPTRPCLGWLFVVVLFLSRGEWKLRHRTDSNPVRVRAHTNTHTGVS